MICLNQKWETEMSKLINSSIFTAITGALILMGCDGKKPAAKTDIMPTVKKESKVDVKKDVEMEKCFIKKGDVGFIKEYKADCESADSKDCTATNKAGDPTAWILVPKGQCDKINMNNFEGVSEKIKAKIDLDALKAALEK